MLELKVVAEGLTVVEMEEVKVVVMVEEETLAVTDQMSIDQHTMNFEYYHT